MNDTQLLDELVRPFDEPADWDDVLRRAGTRRLPRRRLVLTAAVIVSALVVGPALGVLLTRDRGPQLPAGADRSGIAVVLSPVTRRVLLEVAPWKGHDGFCYLVVPVRAGCVPRAHNTVVLKPPLFGWSFDKRIVSGEATTLSGAHIPLTVTHFGGRIDATFFLARSRLVPRLLRTVTLRDARGRVVVRFR
jgi:hypothetical protein